MKRFMMFIVFAVVSANFCQAQYQWVKLTSPTNENLQTAMIVDNGDIYVFGDNAYGAKSTDDGQTWEIITGIDEQSRKITACSDGIGGLCVAGKNGLQKKHAFGYAGGASGWFDNPIYLSGDIEKITEDSKNVYFFPQFGGLGSRFQNMTYEIGGHQYSHNPNLYNFYLPFWGSDPHNENFRYKSSTAGGDRIISFLHSMEPGANGGLAHIFVSDDRAFTWREINFSFPAMAYIDGISFKGNTGFITGSNMGGGGVYLYSSTDNGETWTLIDQEHIFSSTFINVSHSVYADFDGNNYNGIVVGSNVTWNSDKRNYETNYGFVKINADTLINLSSASLNYITGDNNKIIIVGDSGNVFLGKRMTVSIDRLVVSKDNLIISQRSNVIEIKSSKIINSINLFDVSGTLLRKSKPNQSSATIEMNYLPAGIYFVQVDGEVKKFFFK